MDNTWSDGDGCSRHNMAHWESAPPAGERQYLTQQEREHQWLNHEEEAAMRAHYNCHRQNSQMDFRGHWAQETQSPPLYHQGHHRMAQSQKIRDWPNLYGPLRCQASPNVTLHRSGARTETWAKYEPHLPSYEFLPPLIVERGHEDISLHHNVDRDYMVGRVVNHNILHYLVGKWQMFNSTHARGHFNEHSRGHSNECSRGCSRGGSSEHSRDGSSRRSRSGSSGRSRGGSSGRSRGGSSGRSRGGSSGCSRAHSSRSPRLDFQAKHVNPSQTTTNTSPDIQHANINPTAPVVNNKHSETTSGRTAGPVRDSTSLVQAFTATAQQCVSMDLPSTGGRESGVVDLKAAQVTNADTHGILGPSVPSQAITQQTNNLSVNATLVSHTQTSATPEQQHAPSPSPKPLTETPQDKPPHNHKISLSEIQDWLQSVLRSKNGPVNGNNSTQDPSQSQQSSTEKMDVLQAGNTYRLLNTKDDQARPPERFSAEDSTVRLEIKSTPRCMTLTAVATTPPPVAIVPPMGPQQSPEPMETENAGNEVPFKILHAWSINEQQVESLWESAKDDASSRSVLNETVQVESVMECDKPVDASATSLLASTGEDNGVLLVKSSPSPFVHTNPQATDIVRICGTQTIVDISSNGADERTLDLSTISEVQFKLTTLQQLVSYLESAATVTDAKDGCLKAILERYWGGDTSNLVKALKDKRDEKIMQDVSAWAVEDEKAVVVFAVSGISLGEVVENFPIPAHVDSSSHMGYRSSWLNVNEKLYDIDKESGRAWSLWFIPDKAEESSKVVGGVKMNDTFHSKMETVDLPARQPVEAEATDSDLATNTALMMDADPPKDTDLPKDADSETEPLSPMILTVLTSEDAVRLLAETEASEAELKTDSNCPTDADLNTVTDLTTDSDTDLLPPMNLTILTSEDAMRLFCQIENGSDLQLWSPEPCSENKDKTQTKQLKNIVIGSLDKSCYCPCIIETDNGFESGLCSSCQREKGLQKGTRCITISHCLTLSDTSENSDQETEATDSDLATNTALMMDADPPTDSYLPRDADSETEPLSPMILTVLTSEDAVRLLAETDSGGKATVDNQCRDKKQMQSTEEEGDDNQFSDIKTEGEMQQCTNVVPITDFFFWSDTSEDSDQETEENPNEQHAQIEAHASNVKRTEPETDAKEPCESAQEHTTHRKVSPSSEDRERWQEKDQDCRMSTSPLPKVETPSKLRANIIADNWCSPIEDCGSPVDKYDKVADFFTQYKTCKSKKKIYMYMEKENTLHPKSSDRQKLKKSHGRAERRRSPSQPPKSSGVKATVNNQRRDKKPHASHKRRHSTKSDKNQCKDKKRGSSTEKESKNNQSRDKKRRPSIEKVGEGSQSRDKISQKRRTSTETEGRNSGDSKELQCQLVERERDHGSAFPLPRPGVKTLHVQGSSTTTVPLKLTINVPKNPSTNCSPSKHTEDVPKMPKEQPKTKVPNKRHCSPAKSVSPVVKERQRNGIKHKQKIQRLKVRLEKLSLSKHLVRKGSPPRLKRVEDREVPGGLGVKVSKNPDSSMKLKHKAESDLTSQQKLTKIPKVLNRNEKGWFSKSECENDSPPAKPKLPRIPKLPRTPEVSKDGKEGENREETSPSASPESQTLNKPARVAHKPKPFIKPASPNGNSPGSHACPNPARVSPLYGDGHFGAKVSARQQVFSDWESSFVPTPTPRTRRRSGCPQDIGELKPGPSGACEKSFKRKREIHEPAAILMKKSIVQANHWMKCLHREPPKDSRHSAKTTGVGYKWSEEQKTRPN
ncbi:uncharacterized protein LOC121575709 isoform X2 [Coregonus clupeaformis]|uniref:uncharacterized protein LOC121575709 isoform X2 n=1 Tax=Coregonus clupeaformis TaxID=59861 RepID=UPI001E1C9AA9|nr:uncharacterized protein LOC121575709 isoform X2 [Coregonus clupeaformis]